jgi:hypothetical protein
MDRLRHGGCSWLVSRTYSSVIALQSHQATWNFRALRSLIAYLRIKATYPSENGSFDLSSHSAAAESNILRICFCFRTTRRPTILSDSIHWLYLILTCHDVDRNFRPCSCRSYYRRCCSHNDSRIHCANRIPSRKGPSRPSSRCRKGCASGIFCEIIHGTRSNSGWRCFYAKSIEY